MLKLIYNIGFTILSLSIAPWIYAIKRGYDLPWILKHFCGSDGFKAIEFKYAWVDSWVTNSLIFLLYLIILCLATIGMTKLFSKMDTVQIGQSATIEPLGGEMMLTYFGLFFYSLSVDKPITFVLTFIVLFICVLRTQQYMFNPLLTLLGYRYYKVISGGKGYLWITKTKIGFGDMVTFDNMKEINDHTITNIE